MGLTVLSRFIRKATKCVADLEDGHVPRASHRCVSYGDLLEALKRSAAPRTAGEFIEIARADIEDSKESVRQRVAKFRTGRLCVLSCFDHTDLYVAYLPQYI